MKDNKIFLTHLHSLIYHSAKLLTITISFTNDRQLQFFMDSGHIDYISYKGTWAAYTKILEYRNKRADNKLLEELKNVGGKYRNGK